LGNYTLAHGSPREPVWEYILDPLIAALNFPHFETPYCLVGHTHTPVIFQLTDDRGDTEALQPAYREAKHLNGHRLIINPGSVGRRADSNAEAAYGICVDEAIFEHAGCHIDQVTQDRCQTKCRNADRPALRR
jgi:predicted phosphodiesterase